MLLVSIYVRPCWWWWSSSSNPLCAGAIQCTQRNEASKYVYVCEINRSSFWVKESGPSSLTCLFLSSGRRRRTPQR
jgi:hypothetical protein